MYHKLAVSNSSLKDADISEDRQQYDWDIKIFHQ